MSDLLERVVIAAGVLELRFSGAYLGATRRDRFFELLSLVPPGELGLTPPRLAALAMLDELRTTADALIVVGQPALAARIEPARIVAGDGRPQARAVAAVARRDDGWRFLLPSRHVADLDRTLCQLGFAYDAAAFSPDGEQLLVVADDVVIVDIASGACQST